MQNEYQPNGKRLPGPPGCIGVLHYAELPRLRGAMENTWRLRLQYQAPYFWEYGSTFFRGLYLLNTIETSVVARALRKMWQEKADLQSALEIGQVLDHNCIKLCVAFV